ncbi:MAG: hypothetical protein KDB40_20160 [Acidimicrobiales bacterium]|nr:hypothetical protein [Acidimicrobiales bacterium]MCB9395943.1 hypothetical protein [Acidimicrobiaceae bacterium]
MPTRALRRLALSAVLPLAAVAALPACSSDGGGDLEATPVTTIPGPYTFDYTIPEGTAALIAVGQDPKVMPTEITAKVGDTIRIVNDDRASHTVGTFYVLAGTTLTYRFTTVGVFEGVCSTTPEDEFILTVTEA